MVPIAENIPYEAARGLEQWGIMYYGTLGGKPCNNQINGISPKNIFNMFYIADAVPYASKLKEVMEENNLKRRK